jgi:UDP-N-acetylglucosamine 1-carboxyvinyltransferase
VKASAPNGRLPGGDFSFPMVSVGATENAVMAAVLAKGKTQLFNAAREPEIVDLCNLLVAMGAKISGIGSGHLIITGVEGLNGTTYEVMPDRIEAGSYACAAGITGGSIDLIGARPDDMRAIFNALKQAGLWLEFHNRGVRVSADGKLRPLALSTSPFPGFPTDMQAQFMAMLSLAEGDSFLEETIFENRYMHVPELVRSYPRCR